MADVEIIGYNSYYFTKFFDCFIQIFKSFLVTGLNGIDDTVIDVILKDDLSYIVDR